MQGSRSPLSTLLLLLLLLLTLLSFCTAYLRLASPSQLHHGPPKTEPREYYTCPPPESKTPDFQRTAYIVLRSRLSTSNYSYLNFYTESTMKLYTSTWCITFIHSTNACLVIYSLQNNVHSTIKYNNNFR